MNKEESLIEEIDFQKRGGLVIGIAQDALDGEILMVGYVSREALDVTLQSGLATFFSTSRKELWTKGLTSGDTLRVKEILVDCDQDSLIYKVIREGQGACHTKNQGGQNRKSCFYRTLENGKLVYRPGQE